MTTNSFLQPPFNGGVEANMISCMVTNISLVYCVMINDACI